MHDIPGRPSRFDGFPHVSRKLGCSVRVLRPGRKA